MKITIAAFAVAMLALSPATYAADSYTLDPSHTNLLWHASHFGFSSPSGKFTNVEGSVTLDETAPQNSKMTVTIQTASILTGIEKFDAHLKSADFFNVEKFPKATFVSDNIELTGDNTANVTGTLTLLGIAKPVSLGVTLNKLAESPITKKKTAGFSARGVVRRSDFGMTYALPGVSDAVDITIEAEAILNDNPQP